MTPILNFDSDDAASGMSADARHDEAIRILKILIEADVGSEFEDQERRFCTSMLTSKTCSLKQLVWLRELKTKYVE